MRFTKETTLTPIEQREMLLNYIEYLLNLPKFIKKDTLLNIKKTLMKRHYITIKQFGFIVSWMKKETEFRHLSESTITKIFDACINRRVYESHQSIWNGTRGNTLCDFFNDSSALQPIYTTNEITII